MQIEEVVAWIAQLDEDTSRIIRDAIISRRETLLQGGHVVYDELSKEKVEYITNLMRSVELELEEEK